ncbi:hypothetical protein [Mycolicibacterium llatzerense]|uniref:hypothetical protein n=1 Tax=Mycolicibacterium llatzerense TaxID=280871 RepID=UPI0021B68A39|nr:hypothetical protein [Mycolicibacterium llatzerense]MCT7361957.1 hypothetical protein [Mycolicibacterium llatzerense]
MRRLYDRAISTSISSVLNFFGILGSILGLVVAVIAIVKKELITEVVIPIAYVCALSAVLVVWFAVHQRRGRYAEVPAVLEKAYRNIQEAADSALFDDENFDLLEAKVGQSIDALAQGFTLLTGSTCRVCIAELYVDATKAIPEEALVARVVFRSGEQEGLQAETAQPVDGNSDFLRILQTQKPFFHNDLGKAYEARKYENTKWNPAMIDDDSFPYRSTIVWPIKSSEGRLRGTNRVDQPLAFLCVDTPRAGAFVQLSDVPLGACYSYAIYPVVRRLLAPDGARDRSA